MNYIKIFFVFAIVLSQICCGEKDLNIDLLLEVGYKKANCNSIERVENKNYSTIEVIERVSLVEKDLIVARCYKFNDCNFSSKYVANNVDLLCQKYIVKNSSLIKNDMYNNTEKVLEDHTLLYLID